MSRLSKPTGRHPAVVFSPQRAEAWLKHATDEDFYEYLDGLRAVYAKRKHQKGSGSLKEDLLDKDFKKWKDTKPW